MQSPAFDRETFRQFKGTGYPNLAGAVRGTRLLNVACGPGRLSAAASQRGCLVTGIDFAEPTVALARQCCPQGAFHVGDAESLPFKAGSFRESLPVPRVSIPAPVVLAAARAPGAP